MALLFQCQALVVDAQTVGLLKKLGSDLAYRSLKAVIGRQVTVTDYESLGAVLRHTLELPATAALVGPQHRFFVGAIAKYGIIDVTLSAPRDLLTHADSGDGIGLLRDLGFVDADAETDQSLQDATSCLQNLADELVSNESLIRLFLQSEPTPRHVRMRLDALPEGYLPRDFTVVDACVTNCGGVWMLKHFYL